MASEHQGPIVLVTSGNSVYHPRHYHLLAVGLARAGLPTLVVGQEGRHDGPPPVEVRTFRGLSGRIGRIASAPLALWAAARAKPSLIQVNSLDLLPWAVLAKRLARVPVIYDSNEHYAAYMLIKEWLPRSLRVPVSRIVGAVEPWLAARLDATLVADADTAEQFERSSPHVLVVHNFAWRSFGEVAPAEPRYDVIHHGSLPGYTRDNVIGTAVELEARGITARWCLAVRTFGRREREELADRLAHERLTDRFSLLYDLPYTHMPELLAQSRVGFIPLPDEQKFRHNIPRKLFEFLALGRPVVASDLPPIRQFVEGSGCCLLVRPGDIAGYADAIAHFLSDEAAAGEAGDRGRQLITERMNADSEIAPYVDLCRRLSGGGADGDG